MENAAKSWSLSVLFCRLSVKLEFNHTFMTFLGNGHKFQFVAIWQSTREKGGYCI